MGGISIREFNVPKAEAGNIEAQLDCAYILYSMGSYGRAVRYNSLAAVQDHRLARLAQNNLAFFYINGLGIAQDMSLGFRLCAESLCNKAAVKEVDTDLGLAVGKSLTDFLSRGVQTVGIDGRNVVLTFHDDTSLALRRSASNAERGPEITLELLRTTQGVRGPKKGEADGMIKVTFRDGMHLTFARPEGTLDIVRERTPPRPADHEATGAFRQDAQP